MAVLLVIRRMRHTFGNRTQLMYLVDLPQDCLEMRFDGFAERPVPDCGDPAFAQLKSSD